MSLLVVWIDQQEAKIFDVAGATRQIAHLKARHQDHHTHRPDQLDKEQHESVFFSEVAAKLGDTDRLLILGPGVAKYHFQKQLHSERPILAKNVVASKTVDHPTDNQIAAMARIVFEQA